LRRKFLWKRRLFWRRQKRQNDIASLLAGMKNPPIYLVGVNLVPS